MCATFLRSDQWVDERLPFCFCLVFFSLKFKLEMLYETRSQERKKAQWGIVRVHGRLTQGPV